MYSYFTYTGLMLLNFLGLTVLLSTVGFILNISIQSYWIVISLLAIGVQLWNTLRDRCEDNSEVNKHFIKVIISFLLLIICSVIIARLGYDFSWDGQTYHQEAVIQLANGWNPIQGVAVNESVDHAIWINSYPKGLWVYAASIYKLTGYIEAGKSYYWLLAISAYLLAYSALRTILKTRRYSIIISILLVANPVVLVQIMTYYNDGAIYLIILSLISMAHLKLFSRECFSKAHPINTAIVLSLIVLVNIKFTGLIYAIIFCCGFIVFSKLKENKWTMTFKLCAIGLAIGLLVAGFNPYITNITRHGHPFWPLAGQKSLDIISIHEHPDFLKQNRFIKFLWSNFSQARNTSGYLDEETTLRLGTPKIKVPFSTNSSELKVYLNPDARIGGFGPWFGIILIVSICLAYLLVKKGPRTIYWRILLIGIILSTFINPEPWWARYIPQFWMVPIIVLAYSYYIEDFYRINNNIRLLTNALLIMILLNSTVLLLVSGFGQAYREYALFKQFRVINEYVLRTNEKLSVEFNSFHSNGIRLQEKRIPFNDIDVIKTDNYIKLKQSETIIYFKDPVIFRELMTKYKFK